MVTRIGDLIGDPNNTRWSASKKQDKIQEGQERFVLDTRALTDNTTTTVVDGTQEYSLPSDVLDIKRMAHRGLLIRRIEKFDLDILRSSDRWDDDTGTPKYYYVDLDPNNKKFGLFPIPKSEDAGANLTVEYIKIPPTLSADADVPLDSHTLLTPYHMAIAYWAAAEFLRADIRNNPNPQAVLIQIDKYEREYGKLVSHCIETFGAMAHTKPFRMRGGRYHAHI